MHRCKVRHVDFYADDWISGTSELTLEQRGMYITAVALIYSRGGPVTRDHLQRVCAVHGKTFNRVLGSLLALGKLSETDGKIAQKRAEKELKKSEKRVENWRKNLDNCEKSTTYACQADPPIGLHSHSQSLKSRESLSQPSLSPASPARARETHVAAPPRAPAPEVAARDAPEGRAGQAGRLAKFDIFEIKEEWIAEAEAERAATGLPPVDCRAEGVKLLDKWKTHPPRNPKAAFKGWIRLARPEPARPPAQPQISDEEEEALRQQALQECLAEIAAQQAAEARA